MKNLTAVALNHKSLVWYLIIMTALAGVWSYFRLGRMEDPAFTIREMLVSAAWPGATADEMQRQITDKLEKRLQDTPGLDHLSSETRSGTTVIYVALRDDFPSELIRPTWRDVRNLCEDIKGDLPAGTYGPYYNDRFDEVFGSVYALTGDGADYEELRRRAEDIRQRMLSLSDVKKVELIGVQTEKIYVEFAVDKLAQLGLSPQAIATALSGQGTMVPAGEIATDSHNVKIRLNGVYNTVEDIRETPVPTPNGTLRLADIATVERKFTDPAEPKMYFNGEPAVGIAASMQDGANILHLGDALAKLLAEVKNDLPVGVEIHQVANQPQVVDESIFEFIRTLFEAILIVLVVSFLSLGVRTGLVVAGCIPLVLAGVFTIMLCTGIDLQKVSLGALIISLGLLVDDAIIAVEMMSVQLERGLGRFEAACYAFDATAKPMLTGTLITCAGFIPVAFSQGMASEFCGSLFPVISAALLLSWIISVTVAPLYGTYLIRVKKGSVAQPHQNAFYRWFRRSLAVCLNHRKTVLSLTCVLFALSLWSFQFIREEFFPPSIRPEIILDLEMPQGSSLSATERMAQNMAERLDEHRDKLASYAYYVGRCAPRFVLTFDPRTDADNFAQFVIVTQGTEEREFIIGELQKLLDNEFSYVNGNIKLIETGPPADYPLMLRVSAKNADQTKAIAQQVATKLAEDTNNYGIKLSWNEKAPTLRLELDQAKLKTLGLSSETVAKTVYTEISGADVAEFYTGDRTIGIALRLTAADRSDPGRLSELPLVTERGQMVPLGQVAKLSYAAEDVYIERRDLKPTITVTANVKTGTANDNTQRAFDSLAALRAGLPPGAEIKAGGALEDSDKSLSHLMAPVPVMIFVIMTLLMLQLHNGKLMLLTLVTAPLGIIGVSFGMLVTDSALGFVADLGILALSGMIIRNSVILIDQIQKHLAAGEKPWDAVIDSAVLRFRPIMLTAAAAILGMLPLMASNFWGPMAVAIAAGLLAATVLTLLVLPTLYAAVYGVTCESVPDVKFHSDVK